VATTGIMLGTTYANTSTSTIPAEVMAAINQLLANQTAIMQQMAVMSFSSPPSIVVPALNVPPIQSVTIPNQNLSNMGGFNQRNKTSSRRHLNNRCNGCRGSCGCGQTLFATHMASPCHRQGQQQCRFPRATTPGNVPPQQQWNHRGAGVPYSNIYKHNYDWNVCFYCEFDVEDSHISITCPFQWVNHQAGYI
jgi:hypothetical protein